MNVDALSPCSAVQIQYVSIAFTCRGSASPRHWSRNLSAAVLPPRDDVVRNRSRRAVGQASRASDDRHHLRRQPAEVLARLLVRDLVELAQAPMSREPRGLGLEIGRRVAGEARRLVRLGLGHHRVEVVVDEQAPDPLVRVPADELLDVDAPIAEDAALAVGLGDLGLDRDDAFEPRLEVARPRSFREGRYLTGIPQACQVRSAAADGPSRHPHSRRRDRAGAHRSDASRPRGDRGRVRMGRPPSRRRRDGGGGHTPTRGDARVGEGERRRAEGADHDADRHRLPLRQRRAAPRARAVRLPASVQVVRRACARGTRTSTSSSCARTRRTSTRASSTKPAPTPRRT